MLKATIALFLFVLAVGTARAVPVPLDCAADGSVCSSGVAPLSLTGMIDPDDDFLIHWWLRFEDMQHLEPPPPGQPWSLLFDFTGNPSFDLTTFYDWEAAYLTDMDTPIPATDVQLVSVTENGGPGDLNIITDWVTQTNDPVYIHDFHITLRCLDNCPTIPFTEIVLDDYVFRGGTFTPGVWLPEPTALALLGLGLLGTGYVRRSRPRSR